MKRTIIAFACLTIIGSASSCKKYLDTQPTDFASTGTYYSSQSQVDFALSGIYNILRSTPLTGRYYDNANAATDESYYQNINVTLGPATFTNSAGNGVTANQWNSCYQAINYANTLMDNLGNATGLDPVKKNIAMGEALFLRAYFYFLLVQWYGGVPLHLHAAVTITDGQLARSTDKEVYDQVITDMTQAETLLQTQTFASLGYSERVTVDAVQGMLARVCLYAAGAPVNDTKRYADARTWSLKLINAGKHSLVPYFANIFINEAKNQYNNETIWEEGNQVISIAAGQNLGGFVGQDIGVKQTGAFTTPFLATDSGYCDGYLGIQPRLYRAYAPGDLRRDRTIGNYNYNVVATPGSITPFYLNENQLWERYPAKWRRYEEDAISKVQRNGSQTNFPLLRYADVLLMFAEADNEVNQGATNDAYTAINMVRRRAYATSNIIDHITVTNNGAYSSVPPITISGGGGTGAAALAFVTNSQISSITVITPGSGFTSVPTVTVGLQWTASKAYVVNDMVTASGRLYKVTTAGTSTATAPTNTSGASAAATTGAVFTYIGLPATATAVLSNHLSSVDLAGLGYQQFKQAIRDERYKELAYECVRYQDLKRWGILYDTVRGLAADIGGSTPGIPVPTATFATSAIYPVSNITPTQILWPIPNSEKTYNTKIIQNPGY